jgi:signal transduction histidine kinase
VHVHYDDRELALEVDDDGGDDDDTAADSVRAPQPTAGTGNGIVGMRERAAALGGELRAGPRADGGFRVSARLPLGGEA